MSLFSDEVIAKARELAESYDKFPSMGPAERTMEKFARTILAAHESGQRDRAELVSALREARDLVRSWAFSGQYPGKAAQLAGDLTRIDAILSKYPEGK